MADNKPKFTPKSSQDKQKSSGSILKILLIVLILIMLSGVGFAAGVYLKLVDLQGLSNNWKLYDYPVIGQYFTKPQTNFEPVELDNQPAGLGLNMQPQQTPVALLPPPPPPPSDPEQLKQAKLQQQEEAKRIGKMARLYGTMKPDEAVIILNKLDDETVLAIMGKMEEEQVAKIMALFDPNRAARLTQSMLRGKNTSSP